MDTSGTGGVMSRARASRVRNSMIAAMSSACGQRVVHVWQAAHSQGVRAPRAMSSWPSCNARMIWLGCQSKNSATGQPLVHLTHW